MKLRNRYLIGGTIGLIVAVSTVVPVILYLQKSGYSENDPIIIWEDADFEAYDFPGNGTIDDPYVIKDRNITTSSQYAIQIRDTSKYFVIKNC